MVNIKVSKSLLSTGEFTTEVSLEFPRSNSEGSRIFFESAPSGCTLGSREASVDSENDKKFEEVVRSIPCGVSQKEFDEKIEIFGSTLSTPASLAYFKSNPDYSQFQKKKEFPKIICNVINGGKHTGNNVELCEFMIIPQGKSVLENISMASKIYLRLADVLDKNNENIYVTGREGGFVTNFSDNEGIISMIDKAIELENVKCEIGIDIAANNFCEEKHGEFAYRIGNNKLSSGELYMFYINLINKFERIKYLEDPFHENDLSSWRKLMNFSKKKGILIVADDLTVSQKKRIDHCKGCFNAVIIKPNQVGNVTSMFEAIKEAEKQNSKIIISQRSGETDSSIIADIAINVGSEYIKAGAPARERIIKYNYLLRMEQQRGKI